MPTPEYCFLWINWWPLCMTKAEWSGWAQVLGAVGAIVGAWAIAHTEARRRERDSQREQLDQALALARVVAQLTADFDMAIAALQAAAAGDKNTYDLSSVVPIKMFATEEQSAAAIPAYQIRDPALGLILIRLQQLIPVARDATAQLVHEWFANPAAAGPDPMARVSAAAGELRKEAVAIRRKAEERLHAATRSSPLSR